MACPPLIKNQARSVGLLPVLTVILLSFLGYVQSSTYRQGDGQIRIFNYHLNEFAEIQFRDVEKLLKEELEQVKRLLRSRDDSSITEINPKLLDLIDHLQDHFGADTIEIISGYRSKGFNEELLKTGHAVSPVSLHTKGEALDIHIDEIREETLRDYLLSLKLGGVGYYANLDFIHIDTGPARQWGGGSNTRKLVGVLDPQAPVQLTSDKNDYLPDEILNFTWDFKPGWDLSKVKDIQLEHFFRGKWVSCPKQPTPAKATGLPASSLTCPGPAAPLGKFRWTFRTEGKEPLQSSNEFYLKKS